MDLPEINANAVALSALRSLPNGVARQYSVAEFDHGAEGIRFWVRRAWAIGFAHPSGAACTNCYAVLDVLDANDDIVQDFCIPTRRAFAWWYRTLRLRVVA